MTYIQNIATSSPKNKHSQSDLLAFMQSSTREGMHRQRKLLNIIYKNSGIDYRHSVIPDLYKYFLNTTVPNVEDRMDLFEKEALPLSLEAIDKCITKEQLSKITHIITVSCTGISAPGLEIDIISALGLSNKIVRTAVNFMGCYAAFHGLRIADQICKSDENAEVLLVDVELCSIHFQNEFDDDNILANSLFADGAAAVHLSAERNKNSKFELIGFDSRLALSGKAEMAWKITPLGFKMKLSNYVADIIRDDIKGLLDDVIEERNLDRNKLNWAFHPGGVKILNTIAAAIGVDKSELQTSYDILKENGNMSSVTVLFVLKSLIDKKTKGPIFSAGFGPGLTMEAMTLNQF
ncbi:type III polyketide synthase [Flammeovirga pectinis]|uniref:Type III polyketide synthase n=1 Tax=Flammeovirga pectinis TaxID=2494373 RepID=A0A3Q9FV73_9BACT|nr:type III polyketide synthase [Flammeovirga pectinis]AZQ65318.1 type III polyketide synthase [Flammeovirga pectinis]